MDKAIKKILNRVSLISGHALHQVLPLIGQFLISYFVIFFTSSNVWGEVVSLMIVVNLFVMIIQWGQNTYLLRAFGEKPDTICLLWQESFFSRSVLLIPAVIIFFFLYSGNTFLFFSVILWLTGIFLFRSFDPVHLFVRKFKVPVFVELLNLLICLVFFWLFCDALSVYNIVLLYVFLSFSKTFSYTLLYRKLLFPNIFPKISLKFFRAAFPFFIPAIIGFVQSRIDLYAVACSLPSETLGEYQIFFKVILLFVLASRIIIGPFLKVIYRMPLNSLKSLSNRVFVFGFFISIPAMILIYFLLPIVFRIHFSVYMYLAAFLMIVPFFGYVISAHIMIKYHREKQMAFLFFLAACCNVILNYFLIPLYGALGAISSTAIVQWFLLFVFLLLIRNIRNNISVNPVK